MYRNVAGKACTAALSTNQMQALAAAPSGRPNEVGRRGLNPVMAESIPWPAGLWEAHGCVQTATCAVIASLDAIPHVAARVSLTIVLVSTDHRSVGAHSAHIGVG